MERRITDLAKSVTTKQITGLKKAKVFRVAFDESTDLHDLSRLGKIARYIENNQIYKEFVAYYPFMIQLKQKIF